MKDRNEMKPVRLMIVAGEISGDLHAAALVRELRLMVAATSPSPSKNTHDGDGDVAATLELYGIGGDRLKAEGMEVLEHCSRTGVMGFWEVFKRARFFLRLIKRTERLLDERRPDVLLTVDFISFNMRLAKRARARGIPVVHYVCPQVWAWKRGRIPEYAKLMNRLLVMFPFEVDLWKGTGLDVVFTGHPLVDRAEESRKDTATVLPWGKGLERSKVEGRKVEGDSTMNVPPEAIQSLTPSPYPLTPARCGTSSPEATTYRIALFPGSRRMEVERHLPVMMAAALLIERRLGECHFVIPAPTDAVEKQINAILAGIRSSCRVSVVRADSRVALRDADAAIVKSGTSTLEAALMGCPHVIVYKGSALSAWIIRQLIQIPFVGLPNIVAGRRICLELLQHDFTPEKVAEEISRLVLDAPVRDRIKRDMAEVTALLGDGGASVKAAQAVADFLRQQSTAIECSRVQSNAVDKIP